MDRYPDLTKFAFGDKWCVFVQLFLFFFVRISDLGFSFDKEKQKLNLSSLLSPPQQNNTPRGFWLLTPFQIILLVGIPIACTITAAISFQNIVALVDPGGSSWGGADGGGLGRWIDIFMAINLCVVQVRSFHSLSAVSMVGTLASVFYALVAFIGSLLVLGRGGAGTEAVSYEFGAVSSQGSNTALAFDAANAIATIAFAYGGKRIWELVVVEGRKRPTKKGSHTSVEISKKQNPGHNIAQEIQATLPFPPSTTRPMMNSVHLTFALTAFFFFSVAFTGYKTFGNAVTPNILISLSKPTGVMVAANVAVIFNVLAGFHVHLFPLLDYIDGIAIRRGLLPSAVLYRVVVRSGLVLLISFLAAAIPFFEVVLGLLGALSITPTTFIMPCLLWLKLKKPRPASWEFWFCWLTVPVMTAVMVIGAAGAVRAFIVKVIQEKEGRRPFAW